MDSKWFKERSREAGVTAEDIARAAGRSRTNVSNIYRGRQKMSLDWARAFADVLGVPLDEVLRRAGQAQGDEAIALRKGFSSGDVVPLAAEDPHNAKEIQRAETFLDGAADMNVWVVGSNAMELAGYIEGDIVVMDTALSELARPGDVVIADYHDVHNSSSQSILRRYEPPVLVGSSTNPAAQQTLVVDGRNVVIRGVVVGSWRSGRRARKR